MASVQVVIAALRLNQKATLEDVDDDFPLHRVPGQASAWLEREEDMSDGRTIEDRDLTVAILGRMVLSSQIPQQPSQIKGVGLTSKAIYGSPPQPFLWIIIADGHALTPPQARMAIAAPAIVDACARVQASDGHRRSAMRGRELPR